MVNCGEGGSNVLVKREIQGCKCKEGQKEGSQKLKNCGIVIEDGGMSSGLWNVLKKPHITCTIFQVPALLSFMATWT